MSAYLRVFCPRYRQSESRWVINVIFREFLGIGIAVEFHEKDCYALVLDGRTLELSSIFFQTSSERWLTTASLPAEPICHWRVSDDLNLELIEPTLPVLYGRPGFLIDEKGKGQLALDIFGSVFFMLSRYEEMVLPERDSHDRFPGAASLADRAGFLRRPIVDEYVEVLWSAMKTIWPRLERVEAVGSVVVTCDVDEPYERWIKSPLLLAKGLAGALGKRRSPSLAARRIRNAIASKKGDYRHDPNWNFDWYMDVCERSGRQAAFYFIPQSGASALDAAYELEELRIVSLLHSIHSRGHEIGMHGSYHTYLSSLKLSKERERLVAVCNTAGIYHNIRGNRQHFLRWSVAETPDNLEDAGFEYDATGGYADRPGFRYGTSKSFSMWSWKKNASLSIKQYPLVVMEGSVFSYLNLGHSESALGLMTELKERALRYGGNFSLLWHNSNLGTEMERVFFLELIK